jgi:hypothetical protein
MKLTGTVCAWICCTDKTTATHCAINSHAKTGADLGKLLVIVYPHFGPSARRRKANQTTAAKLSKETVPGSGTADARSRDTL